MEPVDPACRNVKAVAVIPAAGSGVRMGGTRAKQYLSLAGRPVLVLTLEAFERTALIEEVVLVVPPSDVDYCRNDIVAQYGLKKVGRVVPGGRRRQDSVRAGVEATGGRYRLVVVHDGVRPFVTPDVIRRVAEAGWRCGAASAGVHATDTVKEVNDRGEVVRTYRRSSVRLVQTPQAFLYEHLMAAHRTAVEEAWDEATDDSILVERLGLRVVMVEGAETNIKVTAPHDLDLARFLLARRDGSVTSRTTARRKVET